VTAPKETMEKGKKIPERIEEKWIARSRERVRNQYQAHAILAYHR
jgi:hypothetical protein